VNWKSLSARVGRRASLFVVGAAAISVSAVALAWASQGDATSKTAASSISGTTTVSNGDVSVLARPASSSDTASKRTGDLQASHHLISDLGDLRVATEVGPIRLLVAPGNKAGDVCLIVEDSSEDSTAVDCASRSLLSKGAIYLTKPDETSQTADVFLLVGDGVTSVNAQAVKQNVAMLQDLPGQLVELKDQAGSVSTVDLGPQF